MRWSEVDFRPPDRTLRQFAVLWLLCLCGIALWKYTVADQAALAVALVAGGIVGGATGWMRPAWLRPVYVTWTAAAFPLGWLVSHVLLAVLFFGLMTPLALVFKCIGRDPLRRRPQPARASYWTSKPAPADVHRYFRQF